MRLRESAPGVYRLDHDSGQDDDRAVSLRLAALALTEHPESDGGGISVPGEVAARMGITRGGARSFAPTSPYATARIRGNGAGIAAAVRDH